MSYGGSTNASAHNSFDHYGRRRGLLFLMLRRRRHHHRTWQRGPKAVGRLSGSGAWSRSSSNAIGTVRTPANATHYADSAPSRMGDFIYSPLDDRTGRVLRVGLDGQIGVGWTNDSLTPLGTLGLDATRPAWRCELLERVSRRARSQPFAHV